MRGRLIDLSIGLNRKQRITIEVDRDFREDFDRLREAELDVEIKKHRNRRSLSANAYFHVLVSKIAAERGGSEESTKEWLVCEYGALAKDQDGLTVGFKLPASWTCPPSTPTSNASTPARKTGSCSTAIWSISRPISWIARKWSG